MAEEQDYHIDEEGNVRVRKEESSYEPFPAGEYDLTIQNVEIREGKESGDPYFAIDHRVFSGPIDNPDEDLAGRAVWENISPKAPWRITQLLEAVYGPQEQIEVGEMQEFNIFDLFGEIVRAQVGLEERRDGSGQINNISRYLPAEVEEVKPKAKAKKKAPAKKRTSKKK